MISDTAERFDEVLPDVVPRLVEGSLLPGRLWHQTRDVAFLMHPAQRVEKAQQTKRGRVVADEHRVQIQLVPQLEPDHNAASVTSRLCSAEVISQASSCCSRPCRSRSLAAEHGFRFQLLLQLCGTLNIAR
ncbi:MAG: hypothetical protein R3C59_08450 [Planctomycetaceae bacterium]